MLISVTLVACAPTAAAAIPYFCLARAPFSVAMPGLSDVPVDHMAGRSAGTFPPLFQQVQATLPNFAVQDVKGDPGTPIPIKISIPSEVARSGKPVRGSTFVMLRGLPDEFTLSAGFRTRNAWIVSLQDLPQLSMISPPNYRGAFALDVILYWGEDMPPQTRRIAVDIRSAVVRLPEKGQSAVPAAAALNWSVPVLEDQAAIVGKAQPQTKPAAPVLPQLSEAEENALLLRAQDLMDHGNIAAARMLYEDLALRGSARAAYAMGRSFDPEVLKTIVVMGLAPDIEQARHWYRRAAELGSGKAQERLTALNNLK